MFGKDGVKFYTSEHAWLKSSNTSIRKCRSPFGRWIKKVDRTARARIAIAISKIQEGNLALLKRVGGGVLEIRIDFGPGYRVYCGRDGETLVVLLAGGSKKKQQEDIEMARSIWDEYWTRKTRTDHRSPKAGTKA